MIKTKIKNALDSQRSELSARFSKRSKAAIEKLENEFNDTLMQERKLHLSRLHLTIDKHARDLDSQQKRHRSENDMEQNKFSSEKREICHRFEHQISQIHGYRIKIKKK